jgi:geranylgeranyl diphosphate synthase type I
MTTEQELDLIVKKINQKLEPVIQEILCLHVDKEREKLVNYQISVNGKRMRPALAVLSYSALGGKTKDVLYPAAGLEILHNYSLIIDDIIDNSKLRRGEPTTWAKFGKAIAQCIGINYSAAIFQAANHSKNSEKISEIFTKTMKIIADGEILDILLEQSGRENEFYIQEARYKQVKEKDYFEMVSKKTALLFQTSCEIGGICADANKTQINALKNYGHNLGIAFQIKDDILDIFGEEKKFGKKIGADIRERKRGNIVILLALKELISDNRNKFLEIIKKPRISEKDIEQAIDLINTTDTRKSAYELGQSFIDKAKKNLKSLPQNKWNNFLSHTADFAIKRER